MSYLLWNLKILFQIIVVVFLLSVAILTFQIFCGQIMKLNLSILGVRISYIPECLAFLNFFQLNEISNTYDTILDLVFSNERNIVIKR